jgi:hypothetical protein
MCSGDERHGLVCLFPVSRAPWWPACVACAHPLLNPAAVEEAWCERAGYAVDPVGRLPGGFVSRRRVRRLSGAEFVAQLVSSGAA